MDLLVTLPIHSQVSIPRAVALAQLSSSGACSLEVVIWYTDLLEIPISDRGLVQCGRHPNNTDVAGDHDSKNQESTGGDFGVIGVPSTLYQSPVRDRNL